MHSLFAVFLVYAVALLQGIALVTYPAAGNLLTSASAHHLTTGQYGMLFIPMNAAAIIAALFGGNLALKYGLKAIFLIGLACNLLSMVCFYLTDPLIPQQSPWIFPLMMLALGFMGFGFGGTLTTLNAYIAFFFPQSISVALTGLHSLLGIGTAIAPLLFDYFASSGYWWGDPLLLAGLFLTFLILNIFILPSARSAEAAVTGRTSLGAVFWLSVGVVFFYGICETIFGNWATIYLTSAKGLSAGTAAQALSLFWGMITLGRIAITILATKIPPVCFVGVLPVAIAACYLLVPYMEGVERSLMVFGLAGLACSGMFPLSIGLTQSAYPSVASVVSGRLIASYMLGYSFAAFGSGEMVQRLHLPLDSLFIVGFVCAIALIGITWVFLGANRRQA